jgi:parallel beta helix pectate lyase-like protein
VDANGGSPYSTIKAAAALADDGDTILIKQIILDDPPPGFSGWTGYSESHIGGGEIFPITIKAGVTVRPFDGTHTIAIWTNGTSSPPSLFELQGSNQSVAPKTKIQDIQFYGGSTAIRLSNGGATADLSLDVVIARCDFAWITNAIDCVMDGGTQAQVAIRDSKIHSIKPILPIDADKPNYLPPSVGIRLHAKGVAASSTPTKLDVELRNLRTAGLYESMNPAGIALPGDGLQDIEPVNGQFSRLIEVFTESDESRKEHSTTNPYQTIPEVNVQFIGGVLKGAADPNNTARGWDTSVYASTKYVGTPYPLDFTSGYRINTSGTKIEGFRLAGIHGTSFRWTRGEIILDGSTEVYDNGRQASRNAGEDLYCGVAMYSDEGYLALKATDAKVYDNAGHGVYLNTNTTAFAGATVAPMGNFLDLDGCSIYQNGGSGIAMKNFFGGIVGGAWHYPNGIGLRKMPGYDYSVDYGQGVVDGCSISNNGEAGLYFRANGNHSTGSPTAVNTRFLDCVIWNNLWGGYNADLTGEDSEPLFLAPLGHVTMAGNGDSAHDYSIVIFEEDRANGWNGEYEWTGPGGPLRTKFFNSVFERKSSSSLDFFEETIGGVTHGMLVPLVDGFVIDDLVSGGVSSDQIGAAGLRYQLPNSTSLFSKSTADPTPFVDSSNWTTLDPTRFYLANLGSQGVFGITPITFPFVGNETNWDHSGDLRPPFLSGTRDKGAEEK